MQLCIKPGIQEEKQGMLPYILVNAVKHSGKCPQTFRGLSPNILGSVVKHSSECPQISQRMLPNIPGNVAKHCSDCRQTFTVYCK